MSETFDNISRNYYCWFHRPRIISAASECRFLNIFSRQNLLRCLSRLLFLLRWNKYGAKKCLKNHIPFDFWNDSTSANQGAGKTLEKPLKELSWNQQLVIIYQRLYQPMHFYYFLNGCQLQCVLLLTCRHVITCLREITFFFIASRMVECWCHLTVTRFFEPQQQNSANRKDGDLHRHVTSMCLHVMEKHCRTDYQFENSCTQ